MYTGLTVHISSKKIVKFSIFQFHRKLNISKQYPDHAKPPNTASAEDVAVVQSIAQSEDCTMEKSSRCRGGRCLGLEPVPGKHRSPVGCTRTISNDAQTNLKYVRTIPEVEAGEEKKFSVKYVFKPVKLIFLFEVSLF